jgi:catalase
MFMWVVSDRAIPRSYRMMQGFGVNSKCWNPAVQCRLANTAGSIYLDQC